MGGGPIRGDVLPFLIGLTKESQRGLLSNRNAEIIQLMEEVGKKNQNYMSKANNIKLINGDWELLWTTEKETLFFQKNGLFGKPVTKIMQRIDIDQRILNNRILFEGISILRRYLFFL